MKTPCVFALLALTLSLPALAVEGEAEFQFTKDLSLKANETLKSQDLTTYFYGSTNNEWCSFTKTTEPASQPQIKSGRKMTLKLADHTDRNFNAYDPSSGKSLGYIKCYSGYASSTGLGLLKESMGAIPTPNGIRKVDVSHKKEELLNGAPVGKDDGDKFELKDLPAAKSAEEGVSI